MQLQAIRRIRPTQHRLSIEPELRAATSLRRRTRCQLRRQRRRRSDASRRASRCARFEQVAIADQIDQRAASAGRTAACRRNRPARAAADRARRSRSRRSSRSSPSAARARRRSAATDRAGRSTTACAPRPTRPRSWCSCDSPKRSACSTTITVAFGTSTPTSTTVVDTRIWISPAANACITRPSRRCFIRPCSSADPVLRKDLRLQVVGHLGRRLADRPSPTPRPADR